MRYESAWRNLYFHNHFSIFINQCHVEKVGLDSTHDWYVL